MRIALCNEVIRGRDFAEQCALAQALGYDGLEIAPFTLSDEPHRLSASRRSEIRRIADGHDLIITGLHWLLLAPAGLSITSPDAALRARSVDVMRRLIELCADLGGRVLVHGSPGQRPVNPGQTGEDALGLAKDCFAAIAGDAEQAGVLYCIEPLASADTPLINTVADGVAIAEEIGSPSVRSMIDCCAAGQSEADPISTLIERWLPSGHIAHVHLNDPNRRGPGQGELAFAPILATLRRLDYRGSCSIEPFVYEPDGPSSAARAIGYVRGLIESQGP